MQKFKVGDKVVNTINSVYIVGVIKFIDEYGNAAIDFAKADNKKGMEGCPDHVLISESAFALGQFYKLHTKEPVVRVEIVVNPKTRKTNAAYLEDGKIKAEAEAKCNPEDKWDANVGAQLAFRRLLEKVDATIMINLEDVIKGLLKEED